MEGVDTSSRILLDKVLYRVGAGRLQEQLPGSPRPITIWAFSFVLFDVVILQMYKELVGYTATFLINPAWLLSPTLVVLAALGTSYLYGRYDRALELIDIENRTSNLEPFKNLTPSWVRFGLYSIGVIYALFNLYNLGINRILEAGGIAELLGVAVVLPFGYAPVFIEFLTVYIGIMIYLPRQIKKSDFAVHFLDPEGLGGLKPIGELIKLTYYLIVIGLVNYLILTYGPFAFGEIMQTPYQKPGLVVNAAFTAIWILTVGLLGHALYQLHSFLKREKQEELAQLETRIQDVVESPYNAAEWEVTDEEEFQDIRDRMNYVSATREYPTTFAMWSQILIGLIIPKAVQMLMTL
ncbi:hypothetical protein LPA44_14460 [Halobacterium sp. KA-4]|uniref:hypothetical protein n=1 Tax=Halobacterium sp. KA-4 TaxID=2896367 RepID=UPI001E5FB5C2|nr:hypothetical protein [Halobacterium sp. KA-4]MCD2201084.1 hypothetical protein [Halobacterium sp. KA-4]